MEPPRVEEYYHRKHERTLVIRDGGVILYSIDTYRLLPAVPQDARCLPSERVGVSLCYLRTGPDCELVIVSSPGRVELVNYRLTTREEISVEEAMKRCEQEVAEVLRSPERGEG
ncbi:MAG: hypothetical protein F7C34_03215 [Desulfurococcales archaeon]|nr:hypothetical protein [Desulfurococcales archaeon]